MSELCRWASFQPFAGRALAAAALAWSMSTASAATYAFDPATKVWVATVSGRSGNVAEVRFDPASLSTATGDGLFQVESHEQGDRPVKFYFSGAPLDPALATRTSFQIVEIAGSGYGLTNPMRTNIGSDRVATAIQVCVNNDRIKGVRLWGKVVNQDGSLGANERQAEDKRTNCGANDWAARVACGPEKAISAVRLHKRADGSSQSFSGVSIACSRIRVQ